MATAQGTRPLAAGSLAVPEQIGRLEQCYNVLPQPIGKGGYALVYKAVRKSDGVSVAVKKVEVGQCLGGMQTSTFFPSVIEEVCLILMAVMADASRVLQKSAARHASNQENCALPLDLTH